MTAWRGSRCPNPAGHQGPGVPAQGRYGWARAMRRGWERSLPCARRIKIFGVGKSLRWRAAPDPSSPKITTEPRRCPGLGRVISRVGREPFHHRGKQRGANEANWGAGYKRAVLFSAWSHLHDAGDLPLSAREKGSVLATKLLSRPQPHRPVPPSQPPNTGESPAARSAPASQGAPTSRAWPLHARKVPARVWKVGQEITPRAFKIDICVEKPPAARSPAAPAWHCCTELADEDVGFSGGLGWFVFFWGWVGGIFWCIFKYSSKRDIFPGGKKLCCCPPPQASRRTPRKRSAWKDG